MQCGPRVARGRVRFRLERIDIDRRERDMSTKQKALSLGLLAILAMSSLVMNASATVTGHFTSTAADEHTLLSGSESGTHRLHFSIDGGTSITCDIASYSGTTTQNTTSEVTITPTYDQCYTNNAEKTKVVVDTNACDYTFFSNSTTHGTVAVHECGATKAIVITHPNCEITIPEQTPTSEHMKKGIWPTQDGKGLTVDVTVEDITAYYHGGLCVFLGTNHTADMNGSVTMTGAETDGTHVTLEET